MGTHDIVGNVYKNSEGLEAGYCKQCGFAHLAKLPTKYEVDSYYASDRFYSTHSPRDWFSKEINEHDKGLWNSYYEFTSKLIMKNSVSDDPDLLDIGTGIGWFVQYWLKNVGTCAIGSEPSSSARSIGRELGIPVYENVDNCKFDAVRLSLVLEHVLNPVGVLRYARSLLNDDGIVMVVVPNEFNSLQNKIAKSYGSDWFVQKPHINYFSKQTIQYAMLKAGFEIVEQHATFPMELLNVMGYKYLGNDEVGKKCHNFRLRFEKGWGRMAWNLYSALHSEFGWGRETIVIGRK